MDKQYNLKNIRALLTEGFTAEELRRLCFDEPEFRPVYNQLAQNTGKAAIIDEIIAYADKELQMETVLALAKRHNPARYAKHQPYAEVTTNSTAAVQKQLQSTTTHQTGGTAAMAWSLALTNLRNVLATLYTDEENARRVVVDARLNPQFIAFSSKAITNWQAILEEAQNQDQVEALIEVALKDYPNNKSLLGARQAYREWIAQN